MNRAVAYSVHPSSWGRWELVDARDYYFDGRLGRVVSGRWRHESGRVCRLRFPAEVVFVEGCDV